MVAKIRSGSRSTRLEGSPESTIVCTDTSLVPKVCSFVGGENQSSAGTKCKEKQQRHDYIMIGARAAIIMIGAEKFVLSHDRFLGAHNLLFSFVLCALTPAYFVTCHALAL